MFYHYAYYHLFCNPFRQCQNTHLKFKKMKFYFFYIKKILLHLEGFFSNFIFLDLFIFPHLKREIIYLENHIFLCETYEKWMRFQPNSCQLSSLKDVLCSYFTNKKNKWEFYRKCLKSNVQNWCITQEDCKITVSEVNLNVNTMQT